MNPDARLRRALAPVDPPEGFAQRVRARVAQQSRVRQPSSGGRALRWMALAATIVAVLAGPLAWREYEARRDALAARAQVLIALRIASRELNSAHRKVVRPMAHTSAPSGSGVSGKEGRP